MESNNGFFRGSLGVNKKRSKSGNSKMFVWIFSPRNFGGFMIQVDERAYFCQRGWWKPPSRKSVSSLFFKFFCRFFFDNGLFCRMSGLLQQQKISAKFQLDASCLCLTTILFHYRLARTIVIQIYLENWCSQSAMNLGGHFRFRCSNIFFSDGLTDTTN